MSKNAKSLSIQGEVGGPEEDRTPDLLIANDTTTNDINKLERGCSAPNSGEMGGECTDRAQWSSVSDPGPLSTIPQWNYCKASVYSSSDNNYGEGVRMTRQSDNTWESVLTERPGGARQMNHETAAALGWVMAIGMAVLVGVVVFRFLGRPAKCHRCDARINIRDDPARVCMPCGGMNRRT